MSKLDNKLTIEINRSLGRVEGKLDGVLTHLEKINGRLDSHSKKIDTLEDTTNQIIGKVSIFSSICGFIGGVIITIITSFIRK